MTSISFFVIILLESSDLMKTVVITGAARGFGFAMAECFKKVNFNVVICDVNSEELKNTQEKLENIKGKGTVTSLKADVTNEDDIKEVILKAQETFQNIDIWINNAGVNQPNKPIWKLTKKEVDRLIDIDLKGTVICSRLIMEVMIKQGYGAIYNVEGHGSNDAKILGLSLYGTSKRAVTYFTEALAYEAEKLNTNIIVGKITPGIMITNFITTSLGDGEKIELDEKTKKVYNILGDYPETIARFMVEKIIANKKNGAKLAWLTNKRAAWRFMTSGFNKRDFFDK